MTIDEFIPVIQRLRSAYARYRFMQNEYDLETWFLALNDIPLKMLMAGVTSYIMTNKEPPTIADIRSASVELIKDDNPSPLAAWSQVYKAICNSAYHAEEEFNKLSPVIQRAVGSPVNLREMGQMDSKTVNSVEQSHFINAYKAEVMRERKAAVMPERVEKLLEATTQRMIEG